MHIDKRASFAGRWAPVGFYVCNVLLWFATGVFFRAWDLLWLVILTIPAVVLYVRNTAWSRTFH